MNYDRRFITERKEVKQSVPFIDPIYPLVIISIIIIILVKFIY